MIAKDACGGDLDDRDPMQRIIVGNFIDGLTNDAVRIKLIRSNPTNLTESVNMALKEYNILKRINMRRGHGYELSNPNDDPQPMEIHHARPSRKCFKCGRKNYLSRDCKAVRALVHKKTKQSPD